MGREIEELKSKREEAKSVIIKLEKELGKLHEQVDASEVCIVTVQLDHQGRLGIFWFFFNPLDCVLCQRFMSVYSGTHLRCVPSLVIFGRLARLGRFAIGTPCFFSCARLGLSMHWASVSNIQLFDLFFDLCSLIPSLPSPGFTLTWDPPPPQMLFIFSPWGCSPS